MQGRKKRQSGYSVPLPLPCEVRGVDGEPAALVERARQAAGKLLAEARLLAVAHQEAGPAKGAQKQQRKLQRNRNKKIRAV